MSTPHSLFPHQYVPTPRMRRTASAPTSTVALMLRVIDPDERPEVAYRVPWSVDRSTPPWVRIRNVSTDVLECVSTQTFGEGWIEPAEPQARVAPGGEVRVALLDDRARNSCRVTVHWFRPTGEEYAWTVVC